MHGLGTQFREELRFEERIWGDVKKAYTHFQDDDVLVAKVTPCFENGKAGIARDLPNGIGAGSSEFCVFRPSKGIDSRYLLSWFSTDDFRRRATVAMTGSVGLKRVPKDVFLSEQLPLAPEREQQRIADKLDTVLARVDEVNDRLARVAPLLKRFRQSVLAAATSGRLTADWRGDVSLAKSYVDSRHPYGWRCMPLRNIAKISTGSTPSKKIFDYFGGGIPFVKPGDLDKGTITSTEETLSELGALNARIVRRGAVFVSCIGNLGKIGFAGRDSAFNQQINAVEFNPTLVSDRYGYFACMTLKEWLEDNASATTISIVNKGRFELASIAIPPLEEQTEIVRRVDLLFAFADRLEARLQAAQTASGRLTPALLAKAFRGELVPQDPNDEPAAELLRRLAESKPAAPSKGRKRQAA